MRRISSVLNWLAALPVWLAGATFGVGTILATAHLLIITTALGQRPVEWPHWVERMTVMLYWVLLPLAVIVLWSRRRHVEGKIGYVGAVLAGAGIVQYVVLTLTILVWDGALSRGELPDWIMWSEVLLVLAILGIVLLSVAFIRDRGVPRIWPVLLLSGLAARVIFPVPYAMSAVFLLLTALLIADRPHIRRTAIDVPAGQPAH